MSVLGMLAWCAAAVSLWLGARRYDGAVGRAYRWLAGGAALYCAGLVIQGILGGTLNPAPGLSFSDLPPLLALVALAVGTALLTTAEREGGGGLHRPPARPDGSEGAEGSAGAREFRPAGLADGYVMAVALLVIGWVTLFSTEFHRSGERPGTFLLALIHPLADLAVLGALLPMVTTAWRRVTLPYLSLLAIAVADALAVGQRVTGGHLGVAAQLVAGGRGRVARRGPLAGDRGVRLDAAGRRQLRRDHDHRRAHRRRGHPGGDHQRAGRSARGRGSADRGGRGPAGCS